MQIVMVGHVCIDVNTSEQATYRSWGSPLMYMSHYLRKHHNEQPELIAPYGADFQPFATGERFLVPPKNFPTLVYKNEVDANGHRRQYCENSASAEPPDLTGAQRHRLARADIICLAPLLPTFSVEYARQMLPERKPGSLRVLLPQGYLRQAGGDGKVLVRDFLEAESLLPLFDLVIFSELDHPQAEELAKEWASHVPTAKIIITHGEQGASWLGPEGQAHHATTTPVPEDRIVDSVGCGDVFSAAAMYEYFGSRDLQAAAAAGNRAARAKLFRAGI